MPEVAPKPYLRSESEPVPVHTAGSRGRARPRNRKRRRDSKHAFKAEIVHSQDTNLSENEQNDPRIELVVVDHLPKVIQLGTSVDATVVATLLSSDPNNPIAFNEADANVASLFAVATLVDNNAFGEKSPLDAGALTGQRLFDALHPIPSEYSDLVVQQNGTRLVLGFFHFPGLLIRQPGAFRIRVTLHRMSNPVTEGAITLVATDSEPIKVECRRVETRLLQQPGRA